jgi:hypothetical protein
VGKIFQLLSARTYLTDYYYYLFVTIFFFYFFYFYFFIIINIHYLKGFQTLALENLIKINLWTIISVVVPRLSFL